MGWIASSLRLHRVIHIQQGRRNLNRTKKIKFPVYDEYLMPCFVGNKSDRCVIIDNAISVMVTSEAKKKQSFIGVYWFLARHMLEKLCSHFKISRNTF